ASRASRRATRCSAPSASHFSARAPSPNTSRRRQRSPHAGRRTFPPSAPPPFRRPAERPWRRSTPWRPSPVTRPRSSVRPAPSAQCAEQAFAGQPATFHAVRAALDRVAELGELAAAGKLTVDVEVLPLEQAAEAVHRQSTRGNRGKLDLAIG